MAGNLREPSVRLPGFASKITADRQEEGRECGEDDDMGDGGGGGVGVLLSQFYSSRQQLLSVVFSLFL